MGAIKADQFFTIFTVVISFYFGTQAVKDWGGDPKMSNSPLVNYTKLVKNYTKMTNKVNRKITIHHMAGNF